MASTNVWQSTEFGCGMRNEASEAVNGRCGESDGEGGAKGTTAGSPFTWVCWLQITNATAGPGKGMWHGWIQRFDETVSTCKITRQRVWSHGDESIIATAVVADDPLGQ